MPQVLVDCLKEHRERRRNMEYDTGIYFTDDDNLVFSNEEGELRTYYGTRAMFDKLMKKAGFNEYGFHFHTLRHTYSNMLFESGENLKVIQMLLGHKDVRPQSAPTTAWTRVTSNRRQRKSTRCSETIWKCKICWHKADESLDKHDII